MILGSWRTRIGAFKFTGCLKATAANIARFGTHWTKAGVGVSWRTTTEARIAGFHLWRSGGNSWRRVNASLVPAKRTGTARGATYNLVDRSVRRGGLYTYRLQLVDLNGKRSWYGAGSVPSR